MAKTLNELLESFSRDIPYLCFWEHLQQAKKHREQASRFAAFAMRCEDDQHRFGDWQKSRDDALHCAKEENAAAESNQRAAAAIADELDELHGLLVELGYPGFGRLPTLYFRDPPIDAERLATEYAGAVKGVWELVLSTPSKKPTAKAKQRKRRGQSGNDARDKWICDKYEAGWATKRIVEGTKNKSSWQPLENPQAIYGVMDRYRDRHGLPKIKRRVT